jgi:hypothetical protein
VTRPFSNLRRTLRQALLVLALFAVAVPTAAGATATTGASGTTGSSGTTAPAALPAEVISPAPGTPDANPATQISFLGAPATAIRDVHVVGSKTGVHAGKLEAYSTGTGASFLPAKPFKAGEHVTVSARISEAGSSEQVGTDFDVVEPYVLPVYPPTPTQTATATNVLHFKSRTDLVPPTVSVTVPAADASLGDIFVAPNSGPGQPGPMIVDPTGRLIWFHPLRLPVRAFDFNMQTYEGQPVLTWWQGRTVELHGQGEDVIYSDHYTPIATVHAGNGLYADLHDFQITPQGTAFITAFAPIYWNLSSVGGAKDGVMDDGTMQEIDIRTGLVMWQWNALAHVPVSDTHTVIPSPTAGNADRGATGTTGTTSSTSSTTNAPQVLDYFHINSIDPLPDGTVLISSRNTWTIYLVNMATGAIIWQIGGKQSSFSIGTGAGFAWQHDAEMVSESPPGQYELSVFDNEDAPAQATQSRALWLQVNTQTKQVTMLRALEYPGHPLLSDSQGDVQELPNGDAFVGWGQVGIESEFSPSGALTFSMTLAGHTSSFRAYRYVWNAQPVTAPALADSPPAGGHTELYASWNGATGVASWTVLAGSAPTSLKAIGTYPDTGFETAISAPTTARYIQVEAISATGALLHASAIIDTRRKATNPS